MTATTKKYKRGKWSEEDLAYLRSHFPHLYTKDLAAYFNRSYGSVSSMAKLHGIHKSEQFKAMDKARHVEQLLSAGLKYRYKAGNVPMNKGMKMTTDVYNKCKNTMFRKGVVPHNAKYDGYERLNKEGYVEVRVAMGKFRLKHRVIWEEAHGPIPKGYIVTFIDGDKTNITLNNLQMISRVQHMANNSVVRYPGHVRSTLHVISKIKKKLKEVEKN